MLRCGDAARNLSPPSYLFSENREKMDFGLACYEQTSFLDSNKPKDEKGHGSGQLKHQRSDLSENNNNNDDVLKLFKIPMPGEVDFSSKKAKGSLFSTPVGRSVPWFPADDGDGHKMLSFSSEAPHSGGGGGGSSRSIAFSIYQDDHYTRAREFGLIGGGRGPFARLKGPFTPSQWMELEHQALIYKHIVANVPIPSNLLVPLKRSLYSYSLPGSYYPNLLGWGPPFHLGISGSNDPEPGRCRRTDGKKWRCSRDAVPDQKYCDRHINRGRHRSRKPVEGRTGHALSGPTTASKVVPPAGCQPLSTADNASAGLSLVQQPNSATASTDYFSSRSQEFQGLSLIPPTTTTLKPEATPFPIQKQQHVSFQEPSNSEFGVVPSDSLLNPSGRISPAHHFMEEGSWPDQLKPDWTQLSMSIPISDVQVKPGPSLQELDPVIHMGLGIGRDLDGPANKPVAWVGGPLGEALRSQAGSSPTGVLQFVSLSNSSSGSGSSPRSGGPSNDAFGSALLSSAAFRSL